MVTRTASSLPSFFAASSPPKPAPTITTCGAVDGAFSMGQFPMLRIGSENFVLARITRRKTGCHEAKVPLSSAPYAESDRAQQNQKISLETVQNHRDGQSHAATRFPPAFAFLQERETQAPHGQVGRSRQDGFVSNQVEHAVRLIAFRFSDFDLLSRVRWSSVQRQGRALTPAWGIAPGF